MKPLLLLAASLCLLAGCLPTSLHPLGSLENATPEPRLPGAWYGKSGEDQMFLHFVQGKGAELQVVEVDYEKKGEAHTTLYQAYPTEIGNSHYLNVKGLGKQEDYYFVRYQISPSGTLSLSLMSEETAAKAIASGKIKGKVTGSQQNREVKITDSSEHLAAFIGKADPDQLFDQKFGTFKKVTLPSFESSQQQSASKKEKAPAKKSPASRKKKQ
jgi:hypothetical protein